MSGYIYLLKHWPAFEWEDDQLILPLSRTRHKQGRLLGKLEGLGFQLRDEATLITLTQDVVKSSEIEGEKLPIGQVRSSIAKRLGIDIAGEVPVNRNVDGVVEMMLDATQRYDKPLTQDRLFGWHAALFPTGRSAIRKIRVGTWRSDSKGRMQVVSGAVGKEQVHYEAPEAKRLAGEMSNFLKWFNHSGVMDPVLKAALAHLWFVTIHPFEDGNGRIARAIADMLLTRGDKSRQRFYSMSAQIQRERQAYYDILEQTQKGNLNITKWLLWFIDCLDRAISLSEENLSKIIRKAKFWETHQGVAMNPRQLKMVNKLMDGFEGKLSSSKWAKLAKCSPDTALRDIHDLIDRKMLRKEEGGGRSTSYLLIY